MKTEQIKNIKAMYHNAVTVRLISMDREPQMPPGLMGKVSMVDDAGQIHVKWNNGSTLALICGIDKFIAFDGPSAADYLREKVFAGSNRTVWCRDDLNNYTVDAIEAVDIEKLTAAADRYVEKNIGITQELAILSCIPYKTASLYNAFLSVHVLSDEDARLFIQKEDFTKEESEEGCCPKCGNEDLEYDSSEIEDNIVNYPWSCKKCKAQGREIGAISFDGHYVDYLPPKRKNKKKG